MKARIFVIDVVQFGSKSQDAEVEIAVFVPFLTSIPWRDYVSYQSENTENDESYDKYVGWVFHIEEKQSGCLPQSLNVW